MEGYEVLWRVEVRWRVGDAVVIKVGGGLEMQSSTVPQVSELRFGGGLEMQWICSRDAVDLQQRHSGFAEEMQCKVERSQVRFRVEAQLPNWGRREVQT